MARVKKINNPHRQHHKRTSWTRFYLPLSQDWPTWSNANDHPDEHRGPLVGVAGCEKVWLGRNFDDPEQAALIILWHTVDALKGFQDSPACAEFLRGLPENSAQASVTSGASLGSLTLNDADGDVSTSSASRFFTFQWHSPYRFEENLSGRITMTALELPYAGSGPLPEGWLATVHSAFDNFRPSGCKDIPLGQSTRMHFWTAWAWAGTDLTHLGSRIESTKGGSGLMCQFRRWNGYGGATPEREEAAAASQPARESWARAVETVMPPVTGWTQERWDIKLVPHYVTSEDEERNDSDEELQ